MDKLQFCNLGEIEIPILINNVDISEYSIVIPANSVIAEKAESYLYKAASELKKYIAYVSGVSLAIISDHSYFRKDYEILIGQTNRIKTDKTYADEEYSVKNIGNKLYFDGGKRGLIYGIYDFIEKHFGVMFLADSIEKIEKRTVIELNDVDESFCPPFEYREITFWNAFNPDFSVKSKINGNMVRTLDASVGGSVGYVGGPSNNVHTFSKLLPPDDYYKEHPEYYALDKNGVYNVGGLCLSNENVIEQVALNAIKWLEEDPKGVVSVSINDAYMTYCQCDKCKKITEEEGSVSGNVIRFVNAVAKIVEKTYPEAKIDTIVYEDVEKVPNITKPAKNVVIRICTSFVRSHSLVDYKNYPHAKDCRELVKTDESIQSWSKVSENIFYWDYPTHYRCMNSIFPHFHTILKNFQFYLKNKGRGIYINGNGDASSQFSELSVFLMCKCMYNPCMTDQEYENLMDRFLLAYYGEGWTFLKEFMEKTKELAKDKTFSSFAFPNEIFDMDANLYESLKDYFIKAKEKSKLKSEKLRIEKASLQVDYHFLYSKMDELLENSTEDDKKLLVERNEQLYKSFKRFGISKLKDTCFLLTVKDFRQSPYWWDYWDPQAIAGETNQEDFDRDVFVLLQCNYPIGTKLEVSFSLMTSNTNEKMKLRVYDGESCKLYSGDSLNMTWDNYGKYKKNK